LGRISLSVHVIACAKSGTLRTQNKNTSFSQKNLGFVDTDLQKAQ
jgi:hypothetical protein